MFDLIRRKWRELAYSEALKSILEEEEELTKEWYQEFLKSTAISVYTTWNVSSWNYIKEVANDDLRRIWARLCRLNKESRKIEVIKQLSEQKEEEISNEDRKALRQLRKKLEWKPLQLRKGERRYLTKAEREQYLGLHHTMQFSRDKVDLGVVGKIKEIKKYINEITQDEAIFWIHLSEEKDEIEKEIKRYNKSIQTLKMKTKKIIMKLDKNDPTYIVDYLAFIGRDSGDIKRKEEYSRKENTKRIIRQALDGRIKYLDENIRFINRSTQILKDIEKRLKETKPS